MNSTHKFLTLMVGVTLVLGALLLQSRCCKEDPPPPPPVEEKEPTLKIVYPEDTIPYGDRDIVISWSSQNVTRLFINDEEQFNPNFGTVKIYDRLFSDTIFVFKGINKKKEVVEEITIKVSDWNESIFGLVSYFPWKSSKLSRTDLEGNIINWYPPLPGTEDQVYCFYKDGRYICSGYTTYQKWYIKDENTIVINGSERRLMISEEEMIISYEIVYDNQDAWFNMHYIHASDTPLE